MVLEVGISKFGTLLLNGLTWKLCKGGDLVNANQRESLGNI